MPNKTKKKNAFYFFMTELKEKEAAKGCIVTMRTLPNLAHPKWKKLTAEEREPYEKMARDFNRDPSLRGGKLASDGTRVEDNLREQEEIIYRENKMLQDLKHFINSNSESEDIFIESAPRRLLYFIAFNVLCVKEDGTFIPIEVGLVEYSISYGIHREYIKILYPGPPPTGYAGEAKRISDEKHQIDIFEKEGKECNMRTIYEDIISFINPSGADTYPVFCETSHLEKTRGCLDWLASVTGFENLFEVWDAANLLLELRAGAGHPLPSKVIASDLLTKTSFNYHPSTRCEFHEEQDVHYCALSYSKCLCYLFSDALCNLFNVPLTERHIPTRAVEDKAYSVTVAKEQTRGATRPSVRLDKTENYYKNPNNVVELDYEPDPPQSASKVQVPRQPASACLAEQMNRLRLNLSEATVPGHGIGRGIRRS